VEIQLLTEQEVADLLRVKPCTVRNERVRGRLGFVRVGARIFYTPEQVMAYVQQQKVGACRASDDNVGLGVPIRRPTRASTAPNADIRALDRATVTALAKETFESTREDKDRKRS
jgi:hypothetical protein